MYALMIDSITLPMTGGNDVGFVFIMFGVHIISYSYNSHVV